MTVIMILLSAMAFAILTVAVIHDSRQKIADEHFREIEKQ
jgi:hypothetical protein